jgi:hypothetical protein
MLLNSNGLMLKTLISEIMSFTNVLKMETLIGQFLKSLYLLVALHQPQRTQME